MISFDEFKAKWIGNRIDYDRTYGYQCVDLIRQGFYEMHGLPGGGGVPSAINYWLNTPQELLDRGFTKIGNSDVQKGDIVILWGLPGNDVGHIGWGTGVQTGSQIEILEQNGQTGNGSGTGGDAIRTRLVDKSRVAGLLRPLQVAQPTPAAPPAPTYQVIETYPMGKQIQLNKNTNLWGMNYREFQYMADHPVEAHAAGEIWTVTNKVAHVNGHHYYRREGQVDGFNVADCTDYVAPPPPPYVPPAPPVKPVLVEYYDLRTTVAWFKSAEDARKDQNAMGTLDKGLYVLLASDGLARKLTKNNHDVDTFWINDNDNKVPEPVKVPVVNQPVDIVIPEVEPVDPPAPAIEWKQPVTFSMRPDGQPVYFRALNEVEVDIPDLQTGEIIDMPPFNDDKPVPITKWFEYGGTKYYLPKEIAKRQWWNAIPAHLLEQQNVTQGAYSPLDHNEDGRVDVKDIADVFGDFIDFSSKHFNSTITVIKKIAPKAIEAKQRTGKLIDGFTAKRTKK